MIKINSHTEKKTYKKLQSKIREVYCRNAIEVNVFILVGKNWKHEPKNPNNISPIRSHAIISASLIAEDSFTTLFPCNAQCVILFSVFFLDDFCYLP